MLVKLETTKFLIYAELDTDRTRHSIWQQRTGSTPGRAMRFSTRLSNAGIIRSHGVSRITGIPIPSGFRERVDCVYCSLRLTTLLAEK